MKSLETTVREQEHLAESLEFFREIEIMVRLGLMPIQYLPFLKRAFVHIQTDMLLPFPERQTFYRFVQLIMKLITSDTTIDRLIRQRIAMGHGVMKQYDPTAKLGEETVEEGIDLKGTPEGTLVAYANAIKNKIRAGGKPTSNDKALASQAKNELRRRRNVASKRGGGVKEEVTYESKLQQAFEKFGITSLSELELDNKAAFFSFIDSI